MEPEGTKRAKETDQDSSENSSPSLSLTTSLPDNAKPQTKNEDKRTDASSDGDGSSISEHISLSESSSVERDRSFQEIEIANVPLSFVQEERSNRAMEELEPIQLDFNITSDSVAELDPLQKLSEHLSSSCTKNVKSILEEILNNELFRSESEDKTIVDSSEGSLNIFAHVDLDDKSLINYKLKDSSNGQGSLSEKTFDDVRDQENDCQSQGTTKDANVIAFVSEMDSFKEFMSNPSTSSTEYKLYQEEFHNKIVEYHNAIANKDNLIQQLTESLQQSISNREELRQQAEHFKSQILELQTQLEETSELLKQHICDSKTSQSTDNVDVLQEKDVYNEAEIGEVKVELLNGEVDCSKLECMMSPAQLLPFNNIKLAINEYIGQKIAENKKMCENDFNNFMQKCSQEKDDYKTEITRLKDILGNIKSGSNEIMDLKQELESKHANEMEELRTYFEKKCADLEKNYSEEIFSQQSRKMSSSSFGSDVGLTSDLYGTQPGPGGDTVNIDSNKIDINKRDLNCITKSEIIRLKSDLDQISKLLGHYNLDKMTDDEMDRLKLEIGKYDLRTLAKYDLMKLKNDMQNAYHAELEILREDYENRVDVANVTSEEKLKSMEIKYLEEIEILRDQLSKSAQLPILSSTVQEVGSLGDFEITEVIQSYERRLQEQVTLAKIDIIAALESQIQRLAANEGEDEEWPSELLRLRDRFTERYEGQITQMTIDHQNELAQLKEEHLRNLNSALERARRRSLRDSDSLNRGELELVKERDNLKKQVIDFRNLLGELLKYFTQCEDELNNTIVEELFKLGLDKSTRKEEEEVNLNSNNSNSTKTGDSLTNFKRVHLAPDLTEFMNIINCCAAEEVDSNNISIDLKSELGLCLEKLRSEANEVLALTMNIKKPADLPTSNEAARKMSLDEKVSSLARQLISETQQKNDLANQLEEGKALVQSLEAERIMLESQLDELVVKQQMTEAELCKAKDKIAELIESGHKEIVSEGYGENGRINVESPGNLVASLVEFQEKARNIVSETSMMGDQSIVHMIEEFCRMGEKITDESKKQTEDLKQQIDVADKKYRTTCKFLEEQAAEREQEREEAQREIDTLREQLRGRDRDRVSCERINTEVEALEKQLKEMTNLVDEYELKYKEVETEKKDAVDKIYVLRDIIRDLENQIELKSRSEEELKAIVQELECIVKHQTESNKELHQHIDRFTNVSDVHELQKHIAELEGELQSLRLHSELAGNEGTIKQIQSELHQFELTLEKRTKDLEGLHSGVSTNSCSSPSEDMSIRDVVNSQNNMTALNECEVPLQQLARLKEKLLKHSRAEDAAIKRIKDLEMQVFGLKQETEESHNEREILKKQISDQLVLISSLQIRLDDQRIRAEHIEKQTNTSLEVKIFDLHNEIVTLQEKIHNRDKTIAQLNAVLEETRTHLKQQEELMHSTKEDDIIIEMQREIEHLRLENQKLASRINSEAQILPNLVENIISDKNTDIEKLRERVLEMEKQLEMYSSLNLDKSQINTINRLKASGTSLESIISMLELSGPEQVRKAESRHESLSSSVPELPHKHGDYLLHSPQTEFEPEISKIDKIQTDLYFTKNPLQGKTNSTELSKSLDRHVRFEDTLIQTLRNEIAGLQSDLESKDDLIREYVERIKLLDELEKNVENLQVNLEKTELAMKNATETFEKEQNELKDAEKNLRVELAEKKLHLSEKEKQLEVYKQDSQRKDEMYIKLAKEKRDLDKQLLNYQNNVERNKELKLLLSEKDAEINRLSEQLVKLSKFNNSIEILENELKEKQDMIENLKTELFQANQDLTRMTDELEMLKKTTQNLEDELSVEQDNNTKMRKELENNGLLVKQFQEEIADLQNEIDTKEKCIETLKETMKSEEKAIEQYQLLEKQHKDLLLDRECEIEILNEDAKRYQDDLAELEGKLSKLSRNSLQTVVNERDLEIANKKKQCEDLSKEIIHLQDLLNEKDKIIDQMGRDSKSLHISLETIQNKIQETGNIIDLGRRLRDEQKKNASLLEEIHSLKAQLLTCGVSNRNSDMVTSVDEITSRVRRELDYSAHLDSNIINAVSDQSLTSLENVNLEKLKESLLKERALSSELKQSRDSAQNALKEMEEKYEITKLQVDKLQSQLEKERMNLNAVQLEDAKLIEQMRIRLDSALDNENEFEKLLDSEKQMRAELEKQVVALKNKLSNLSTSSNSKTELTEYKALPSRESQLEKHLESLKEENMELAKELKTLKHAKSERESNLKYTKDLLNLKEGEIKNLECRLESMRTNEAVFRENLLKTKTELEDKVREAENTRTLIEEIDQDRVLLKNQVEILNEKLSTMQKCMEANSLRSHTPIPDDLNAKIKELNEAVKDNKQMMDLIGPLTEEKKHLQEKIHDMETTMHLGKPFDPLARANYLFAKYLRSESYRKALVWQKQYLTSLLATYQDYQPVYERVTLLQSKPQSNNNGASRKKKSFKCIVLVVTAVLRMKYMVIRWHTGRRLAYKVNSRHYLSENQPVIQPVTQFQLGQPVSSQQFVTFGIGNNSRIGSANTNYHMTEMTSGNRIASENSETPKRNPLPPWSGVTPPSKDTNKLSLKGERVDLPSLKAPELLSSYIERFNQIQERLGVALGSNSET